MNSAVMTQALESEQVEATQYCAEALFRSADAALKFAFRFSSEQYDRPLMNRMADKSAGKGKGLAGLDGAGQAGIIRREVRELGPLHEAMVIARYGPRDVPCSCRAPCCSGFKLNREWAEAIGLITTAAMEKLSGKLSHYQLRRGIVERQFGVKHKIGELAERCNVNRDTASDHNMILTVWLAGEKKRDSENHKIGEVTRAITAAGERLWAAGFIGPTA